MRRIAWPRLVRLGLRELGLTPAVFWGLTPAELMLMAGMDPAGEAVLTRDGLEKLMARFPDRGGAVASDEAQG